MNSKICTHQCSPASKKLLSYTDTECSLADLQIVIKDRTEMDSERDSKDFFFLLSARIYPAFLMTAKYENLIIMKAVLID